MASETFKKRQQEATRREKKQKKAARQAERKNTREKTGTNLQEEKPNTVELVPQLEPNGKPIYFGRAAMPRDPKRKSEITLYNAKSFMNTRGR